MGDFFQWFQVFTFLGVAAVGWLHLFTNNKIAVFKSDMNEKFKSLEIQSLISKDEMITSLRKEFRQALTELESRGATKEQMGFLQDRIKMMFENLADRLKLSTRE